MTVLIAIGHIVGSLFALSVLGFIVLLIAAWETERNKKHLLEEASSTLGVAVEDLEKEELIPRLVQLSSDRFSSELLKNRLSDFCGFLRTAWGWLGLLLQVAVLLGVVWYAFTDSLGTAAYAWSIVAIWFFFSVRSVLFSLLCRLLTGRYPGQAKQARKSIAEFLSAGRSRRTIWKIS